MIPVDAGPLIALIRRDFEVYRPHGIERFTLIP